MAVELNHTIVHAADREKAAMFLTEILGLPAPTEVGPFLAVTLDNGVSLDYAAASEPVSSQHLAFLISEADFDEVFGRIKERDVAHWADPMHMRPGEINTRGGGRGVYFTDGEGHNLEVLTVA